MESLLSTVSILILSIFIANLLSKRKEWSKVSFYFVWVAYWSVALIIYIIKAIEYFTLEFEPRLDRINEWLQILSNAILILCAALISDKFISFSKRFLFISTLLLCAGGTLYFIFGKTFNENGLDPVTRLLLHWLFAILSIFYYLLNYSIVVKKQYLLKTFIFLFAFINALVFPVWHYYSKDEILQVSISLLFMAALYSSGFNYLGLASEFLPDFVKKEFEENEESEENNEHYSNQNDEDNFTWIEMPNEHRDMFMELMRAFEKFAQLKGYKIYVSFDLSIDNSIGFKFILSEISSEVSQQTLKKDFEEFIRHVKNDESFDQMPLTIDPIEHELIKTILQNKILSLRYEYELELKKMSEKMLTQQLTNRVYNEVINIQPGGVYNKFIEEHQMLNCDLPQDRYKAHQKIDELLSLIKSERDVSAANKKELLEAFNSVKDELKDDNYSKNKLSQMLKRAKTISEKLVLADHLEHALTHIWQVFSGLF